MKLLLLLAACSGADAYIVEGTVLEKPSDTTIVVAHEEIPGFMPAMTMSFDVRDGAEITEVAPGDRVTARLMVDEGESWLAKVRVTGHGALPTLIAEPLRPGEALPALSIPIEDGTTWTLGAGQGRPTAVSFVYTRCPMPEFCPAVIARMQALQGALLAAERPEEGPRILLVTLDPAYDTQAVLASYAATTAADGRVWRMGRTDEDTLAALALRAGLVTSRDGDVIAHALRLLVLDADGRLIERYDDMRWPQERVLLQLRTGGPGAPIGTNGTITP